MKRIGTRQSTEARGLPNWLTSLVPVAFVAVLTVITYTELATMSVALASSGDSEQDSTDLPYVLGEVVTNPPGDTEGSPELIFIEAARPRPWHEEAGETFKDAFGDLAPWSQAAIISGVASAILLGSMAVAAQRRLRRERRESW